MSDPATACRLGVVLAALLGMAPAAVARPKAPTAPAARESTDRRLREGQAALKAGDLTGAERLLTEAYRAHGAPLALFHLGRVALAQGRAVAAQDLLRRYLAATEAQGGSPELRAEAERALATPVASGEVAVLGEPGARVLLDGRLVALLPLPLPLLVAPGAHEVHLELPGARSAAPLAATLTVKAERRTEVRFEHATGAAMVSELPSLLLLVRLRGGPSAGALRLQQAAVERLHSERLTVLVATPRADEGCTDGPRCQLALLAERALAAAVVIDVEAHPLAAEPPPSQDYRLTVSLLDAQVGEVAHQVEQRCDGCTLAALAAQVATATGDVVAQGLGRRRGDLAVVSEPPGALLELSGRVVGPTPFHGVRFAGSYAAVLRHPGYREYTQPVLIEEGKPAELHVKLEPQLAVGLAPPAPVKLVQRVSFRELLPRPRWRLALGGGLLAGGALTAGFGAGALAIDGQCLQPAMPPAQTCDKLYQTMPLGLGLVGAGAAMSLLGVVLLAVPGPHRDYATTVTLAPCPAKDGSLPAAATAGVPLCATRGGR